MAALRLRPSPDVVLRNIADETFLLPVKGQLAQTADLFVLSEVGRFVWDLIDGSRGIDEIVGEVVVSFDVSEPQARADVERFVAQLREHHLVEAID